MSNDNKTNLKADHGQHRELQKRKLSNRVFIVYMLLVAVLFSLLLISSCQSVQEKQVNKAEGVADD